jgi:Holliday junction resolvasome, endonuclease subunit
MGKISIEDIKEQVESKKWKLISTEYKNLDTELCFECPEGHKVYNSWKRMRNKLECPVCKQNVFNQNLKEVKEKKKGTIRVLGLDQATNVTGYSLFDNGKLIASGTYTTRSENESKRIKQVRDWVISMINQWQPDYVGIEDIQFQKVTMVLLVSKPLRRWHIFKEL